MVLLAIVGTLNYADRFLPAALAVPSWTSWTLCIWFIALSYVVGTVYMAPSIASSQRLARAAERATASADLSVLRRHGRVGRSL